MSIITKKDKVLAVLQSQPCTIDQLSSIVPELPKNYASQLIFSLVRAGYVRVVAKDKLYNRNGGYRLVNVYALNEMASPKEYRHRTNKERLKHINGFTKYQVWTDANGIENVHYGQKNLQNPKLDKDSKKALLLEKMPLMAMFNTTTEV
jgi:hypothetical protein